MAVFEDKKKQGVELDHFGHLWIQGYELTFREFIVIVVDCA
jgi:hypothetical protein